MTVQEFAAHLAALDPAELIHVLEARPDVLIEPAPSNFLQLAQRLDSPGGVSASLWEITQSTSVITRAVVALGQAASTKLVAELAATTEQRAAEAIAQLCRLGLAWRDGEGVVHLVTVLHQELSGQLGGAGQFLSLAQYLRVPELQRAARGYGLDPVGTKSQLVALLDRVYADRARVLRVLYQLSDDSKAVLDRLLAGDPQLKYTYGLAMRDPDGLLAGLRDAGLVFFADSQTVVPNEVAEPFSMFTSELSLPPEPIIPDAGSAPEQVLQAATSSAEAALRAVTSLLDDAAGAPITALKKGGVGVRERSRLARGLNLPADQLPLWLDTAYSAGLLSLSDTGYEPSAAYAEWREATPARQWAALALSWLHLDFTPSLRDHDWGTDAAPPSPITTSGGAIRRRLLTASLPQKSIAAVGRETHWFCPLAAPDPGAAPAVTREAELLGVVALDCLSELGRHLLEVRPVRIAPRQLNRRAGRGGYDVAAADELAAYCTDLFGKAESRLILQSDLTAVVSGRPSASLAKLLRAAAAPEARGTAETWRFSATTVRQAMDAGWTAEALLTSLQQAAAHDLPAALTQLIDDVARRHGEVRVSEVRSCLVAEESLAREICHTRSVAKLALKQVAPTVLVSPEKPEIVLPALRAAGFLPVAENAEGTIMVAARQNESSLDSSAQVASAPSRQIAPEQLAKQLHSHSPVVQASPTIGHLLELNNLLNEAELALLADALDNDGDVIISYSDVNASRSTRQIKPLMLFDRWLVAFCRLRNDERHFAVANIQAVNPVV